MSLTSKFKTKLVGWWRLLWNQTSQKFQIKDAKVIFSNSHQKFGTTFFLAVSDSGYNDPLLLLLLLLFNSVIILM